MIELVTVPELERHLERARREDVPVGFVPTMGALHRGHRSLIESAAKADDLVIVSIFVNPFQFGDPRDFATYPRTPDADRELLEAAGASVLFRPDRDELFPSGPTAPSVDPGPIADRLEGSARPGHFVAVAAVVERLLTVVHPTRAYFGEKDFQQLVIVRRLVDQLGLPVEIVGCPTVREPDGLAGSSRNVRLSRTERAGAAVLFRALQRGRERIRSGERDPARVEAAIAEEVATQPLAGLDYAAVVDAASCEAARAPLAGELRLLIAARLGSTRLIDNLGVTV